MTNATEQDDAAVKSQLFSTIKTLNICRNITVFCKFDCLLFSRSVYVVCRGNTCDHCSFILLLVCEDADAPDSHYAHTVYLI